MIKMSNMINIYAPNDIQERHFFFIKALDNIPVVIGGDFNNSLLPGVVVVVIVW